MGDLTGHRRGRISQVLSESFTQKLVVAQVPLKEMIGYATLLRSSTKGMGTFLMQFSHYDQLGTDQTVALLKHMRGE
jgi:elongation factor G